MVTRDLNGQTGKNRGKMPFFFSIAPDSLIYIRLSKGERLGLLVSRKPGLWQYLLHENAHSDEN
jgi:hypothetical protein